MAIHVDVLIETPISFDVGGERVHCPLIDATVNGHSTKLILDTGATDHVLTNEFADRAGLARTPGEPGIDHAGHPVESWTIGDVTIDVEAMPLDLHDVCSFDGPDEFSEWNVGGIVSPQHLHPDAYVVIDLAGDAMSIVVANAPDLATWLRSRSPDATLLEFERGAFATVTVDAVSVDPFDAVTTMLNTGSSTTEFAAAAVPGLRGDALPSTGLGLSGSDVEGLTAHNKVLDVRGVRLPVETLLVRDEMPEPPGLVGMDVLSGTILAASGDQAQPVFWLLF